MSQSMVGRIRGIMTVSMNASWMKAIRQVSVSGVTAGAAARVKCAEVEAESGAEAGAKPGAEAGAEAGADQRSRSAI